MDIAGDSHRYPRRIRKHNTRDEPKTSRQVSPPGSLQRYPQSGGDVPSPHTKCKVSINSIISTKKKQYIPIILVLICLT